MENREYWQGMSSESLAQRFERHASQTQDCIVEQKAEEKRKSSYNGHDVTDDEKPRSGI